MALQNINIMFGFPETMGLRECRSAPLGLFNKQTNVERGLVPRFFVCAPGMGVELEVKVLYGGCSTKPLAKGKGAIVRWGLEEAGGKTASR